MSETMLAVLASQVFTLPLLVAYIIGIALAFARFAEKGRAALLAGFGFACLATGVLINAANMYWQLSAFRSAPDAVRELARFVALVGAVSHLLELIGVILLMIALFGAQKRSGLPVVPSLTTSSASAASRGEV
jgi:hypothetical protein